VYVSRGVFEHSGRPFATPVPPFPDKVIPPTPPLALRSHPTRARKRRIKRRYAIHKSDESGAMWRHRKIRKVVVMEGGTGGGVM
jgi:hypothetical protein